MLEVASALGDPLFKMGYNQDIKVDQVTNKAEIVYFEASDENIVIVSDGVTKYCSNEEFGSCTTASEILGKVIQNAHAQHSSLPGDNATAIVMKL